MVALYGTGYCVVQCISVACCRAELEKCPVSLTAAMQVVGGAVAR